MFICSNTASTTLWKLKWLGNGTRCRCKVMLPCEMRSGQLLLQVVGKVMPEGMYKPTSMGRNATNILVIHDINTEVSGNQSQCILKLCCRDVLKHEHGDVMLGYLRWQVERHDNYPFKGPHGTCVATARLREEIPKKLLTIHIWFPLKAHQQYHGPMTSSLCNVSVVVHFEFLSSFQRGTGMGCVRCSRHVQSTWCVMFREHRAGLQLVEQGKRLRAKRVEAAVLNQ